MIDKNIYKICDKILNITKRRKYSLHEPFFDKEDENSLVQSIKNRSVSTYGIETLKFEKIIKNFTGAKYVHAIINGTSAIHLSLYVAGINQNTEVLIPALNYIASSNATLYLKGTPHFIDVDENTLGPDIKKLEIYLKKNTIIKNKKCINLKTKKNIKAIVATHVFGHPFELNKLKKLCDKYKILLIEDAAEALGSYYKNKHVGTFGLMGILSFNGNKIITTGGGGAILTNSKKMSEKIKLISTNAREPHVWEYKYNELGYNYKMPSLNANLGISQMKKLKNFLKLKRKLFTMYKNEFKDFNEANIMEEPKNSISNYWLQTLILKKPNLKLRNQILKKMNQLGVGARPVWNILSRNKNLSKFPKMNLSKALELEKRIINLPSGVEICQKK